MQLIACLPSSQVLPPASWTPLLQPETGFGYWSTMSSWLEVVVHDGLTHLHEATRANRIRNSPWRAGTARIELVRTHTSYGFSAIELFPAPYTEGKPACELFL